AVMAGQGGQLGDRLSVFAFTQGDVQGVFEDEPHRVQRGASSNGRHGCGRADESAAHPPRGADLPSRASPFIPLAPLAPALSAGSVDNLRTNWGSLSLRVDRRNGFRFHDVA